MYNNNHYEEVSWFKDNIVEAHPDDIITSKGKVCCGILMQEYIGTQFVDWTHKCNKCKSMLGCA